MAYALSIRILLPAVPAQLAWSVSYGISADLVAHKLACAVLLPVHCCEEYQHMEMLQRSTAVTPLAYQGFTYYQKPCAVLQVPDITQVAQA